MSVKKERVCTVCKLIEEGLVPPLDHEHWCLADALNFQKGSGKNEA